MTLMVCTVNFSDHRASIPLHSKPIDTFQIQKANVIHFLAFQIKKKKMLFCHHRNDRCVLINTSDKMSQYVL